MSKCNVNLLIMASESAYRVKKGDKVTPENEKSLEKKEAYKNMLTDMQTQGYKIEKGISPESSGGSGKTQLAATVIVPLEKDDKGPIIIAFRGTKTAEDMKSDIRLTTQGEVGTEFRDDAFKFYEKTKAKYPDREIILTGHSLGGHLAQYVATRAYNEDLNLCKKPNLQVRTFNTAPIDTPHAEVFKKNPEIEANFTNYRTSSDVVSNIPMTKSYGNIFSFYCKKTAAKAHSLGSLRKTLPEEVLNQEVGSTKTNSSHHNKVSEQVKGSFSAYQCRVKGQFFSKHRQGSQNLNIIESGQPLIMKAIDNKDYSEAKRIIKILKNSTSGTESSKLLDKLEQDVTMLNKTQKETLTTNLESEAISSSPESNAPLQLNDQQQQIIKNAVELGANEEQISKLTEKLENEPTIEQDPHTPTEEPTEPMTNTM